MANEIIKRDQNFRTVGAGVTDDASLDISMLRVDPVTGYLLIDVTVTGSSSANATQIASRDENFRPVCLGYDETNDILVEILTDENGYLLADIVAE